MDQFLRGASSPGVRGPRQARVAPGRDGVKGSRLVLGFSGIGLVIACCSAAKAQDMTTVRRGSLAQPGATAEDDRAAGKDHIVLGVGVSHAPVFQGRDRYRLFPVPLVDIVKGRFFANLNDGVGFNVVDGRPFTAGLGVSYLPGYRTRDVPAGIGKLNIGLGVRASASAQLAGAVITAGVTKGILRDNRGLIADAGISVPLVISQRVVLTPSVSASWANGTYNTRYFGVNAAQSRASGLPALELGSGFKDVSGGLTLTYVLTPRLTLGLTGSVTGLLGDAKRSPLVKRPTQPSSFLSLTRSF